MYRSTRPDGSALPRDDGGDEDGRDVQACEPARIRWLALRGSSHSLPSTKDADSHRQANYDTSLQELQAHVQEHVNPLLCDSSSVVKRALLSHVGALCTFFGRLKANDAILAHLVTYLNTRDWLLRDAWNENAVDVASCVGSRSLEEYILPLITLSLAGAHFSLRTRTSLTYICSPDAEESVVARVLATLTTLAERRLLAKSKLWELVSQITGFLCHPNIWIREGTPRRACLVASWS